MTRLSRACACFAALLLSTAPVAAQDVLAGSEWAPETIERAPVPDGVETFIQFGADGAAAGSGGCNRFSGGYAESGDELALGPFAATRMACTGPAMEAEDAFFRALQSTRSFSRNGAMLALMDEDGEVVATLSQRDAD